MCARVKFPQPPRRTLLTLSPCRIAMRSYHTIPLMTRAPPTAKSQRMLTIEDAAFVSDEASARVNSTRFSRAARRRAQACWWDSLCTVSDSGAVCTSTSEEYRCWLILSTFSRDALSFVLTFLPPPPGERWANEKCCYGIPGAPSQVGLTQASCCDGLNYVVYGLRGLLPPCSPAGVSGKWPSLWLLAERAASSAPVQVQMALLKMRSQYIVLLIFHCPWCFLAICSFFSKNSTWKNNMFPSSCCKQPNSIVLPFLPPVSPLWRPSPATTATQTTAH